MDKKKIKEKIENYELYRTGRNAVGGYVEVDVTAIKKEKADMIEVTAKIKLGDEDYVENYSDVYYFLDAFDYHVLNNEEYKERKERN